MHETGDESEYQNSLLFPLQTAGYHNEQGDIHMPNSTDMMKNPMRLQHQGCNHGQNIKSQLHELGLQCEHFFQFAKLDRRLQRDLIK